MYEAMHALSSTPLKPPPFLPEGFSVEPHPTTEGALPNLWRTSGSAGLRVEIWTTGLSRSLLLPPHLWSPPSPLSSILEEVVHCSGPYALDPYSLVGSLSRQIFCPARWCCLRSRHFLRSELGSCYRDARNPLRRE